MDDILLMQVQNGSVIWHGTDDPSITQRLCECGTLNSTNSVNLPVKISVAGNEEKATVLGHSSGWHPTDVVISWRRAPSTVFPVAPWRRAVGRANVGADGAAGCIRLMGWHFIVGALSFPPFVTYRGEKRYLAEVSYMPFLHVLIDWFECLFFVDVRGLFEVLIPAPFGWPLGLTSAFRSVSLFGLRFIECTYLLCRLEVIVPVRFWHLAWIRGLKNVLICGWVRVNQDQLLVL